MKKKLILSIVSTVICVLGVFMWFQGVAIVDGKDTFLLDLNHEELTVGPIDYSIARKKFVGNEAQGIYENIVKYIDGTLLRVEDLTTEVPSSPSAIRVDVDNKKFYIEKAFGMNFIHIPYHGRYLILGDIYEDLSQVLQ